MVYSPITQRPQDRQGRLTPERSPDRVFDVLMKRVFYILCVFCFSCRLSAEAEPWLQLAVDEIESASPIKALAAMPVRLATAVYNALPPRYHEDAREYGFDVRQIAQDVDRLPVGENTTIVRGTIHLRIAKFEKDEPNANRPSSLVVKMNDTSISCPLLFTGAAVKALTFLFEDLKPVKEQLGIVIENVKTVPPGRILWCTDQYDTLEISLK